MSDGWGKRVPGRPRVPVPALCRDDLAIRGQNESSFDTEKERKEFMSRQMIWTYSILIVLNVSAPLHAVNYEVGGCKTGSAYKNFTTIEAAVISVPVGATIQVCPGIYPEQVTIISPLTLQGISFGNADRAVITINPNGILTPNVTSITGESLYAQVLVINVQPPGPVNIIGMTVDGTGGTQGCANGSGIAGIFYASGTSGTVNGVTTRNQQSCGLGNGVWVENGVAPSESIIIENSSIHDMDQTGIMAVTEQEAPALSVTAHANFLSVPTLTGNFPGGVLLQGAGGTLNQNVITGGDTFGIFDTGSISTAAAAVTISGNTVADISGGGLGDGIYLGAGAIQAESNRISNVVTAFDTVGGTNPVVQSNTTMNTTNAFDLRCSSGATITGNVFNDSQVAFQQAPSLISGNPIYNIDTILTGGCP
jgi:hypothetical protein